MTPNDVTLQVQHELWLKQEAKSPQKVSNKEPKEKFEVDIEVRLSKVKMVFAKEYLPNWTEEIFT